jgi:hypothetical protein
MNPWQVFLIPTLFGLAVLVAAAILWLTNKDSPWL